MPIKISPAALKRETLVPPFHPPAPATRLEFISSLVFPWDFSFPALPAPRGVSGCAGDSPAPALAAGGSVFTCAKAVSVLLPVACAGLGMLFWVTEPAGWDLQVPQGWVVLCGRTWWGHQNLPGQGSVGCWNRAVLCLLLLGLELGLGLGLKLEWIIFNQNHSRIPLTPDSPRAQPVVSLLSPRAAHPAPGGL